MLLDVQIIITKRKLIQTRSPNSDTITQGITIFSFVNKQVVMNGQKEKENNTIFAQIYSNIVLF